MGHVFACLQYSVSVAAPSPVDIDLSAAAVYRCEAGFDKGANSHHAYSDVLMCVCMRAHNARGMFHSS